MPDLTHEEIARIKRDSYNLGYKEGFKEGELTGFDDGYRQARRMD